MNKPTVYIIGAGISGLVTAFNLAKNGYQVKVYEATKQAGGRVRSFVDEKLHAEIDNGNHLFLGANKAVLELVEKLEVVNKFNKFSGGKFNFFNAETGDRFLTNGFDISKIPDVKLSDYFSFFKLLLFSGTSVADVFDEESGLFKNFIENISKSILNTSPFVASSKVFRNVILKILTTKNGLDYYYPKISWNDALIIPLLEKLQQLNVQIEYNKSLKRIFAEGKQVKELIFTDEKILLAPSDILIMATPPSVTKNIIDIVKTPKTYNTILNIHFKFDHKLPAQIFAVLNSNIEWVFVKKNIISTTSSAASDALLNTPEHEVVSKAWDEICSYLQLKSETLPQYKIIKEKRATYSVEDENLNQLPTIKTDYTNLFLVGDYVRKSATAPIIPATLEAAIVSANKVFEIM